MAMYDDANTVEKSFNLDYIPPYLVQAQWAEFTELKKRIYELYLRQQRPLSVLDIGVGNARVPVNLSGVPEMWEMIGQYDGTDNAQACIDLSNQRIEEHKLFDKVRVALFDAMQLKHWKLKYDMVITTWFTAGNFYPPNFDFERYDSLKKPLDLSTNPTFTTIFKGAYQLLNPGGRLVLGACYIDNERTRLKQEESYRKMGMTVITSPNDSFTATRQGFWSQRFTLEKLYSYFKFISPSQITTIPLDPYEYAMQVVVDKPA